jgi:hypothetical protein
MQEGSSSVHFWESSISDFAKNTGLPINETRQDYMKVSLQGIHTSTNFYLSY